MDVVVLGGTLRGTLSIPATIIEGAALQEKAVTSSAEAQTVEPDAGYNGLSRVTVEGMPLSAVTNESGGTTVTIG